MKIGENSGNWVTKDGLGTTTTAPHEFGHGLGLIHTPEDMRGKGQPGIMASRGTAVDAEYTYDPKKGASEKYYNAEKKEWQYRNTLSPSKRKVLQSDIDKLKSVVIFNLFGASLGKAVHRIYDANGREI
jgi:hypothetical protein